MRALFFLLIMFTGVQAAANNYFIPNNYRNRRSANVFTGVAWSQRQEVGMLYGRDTDTNYAAGTKNSEVTTNAFFPYGFYNMDNGFGFEGGLSKLNSETTYPSATTKDTGDSLSISAAAGLNPQGTPWAFSLGYRLSTSADNDGSSGDKTTVKSNAVAIGLGYKLFSHYYLGAGYINYKSSYDYSFSGTTYSSDAKNHYYYLGGGAVFGGEKKPMATTELVLMLYNSGSSQKQELTWQGLMNVSEFQFYSRAQYAKTTENGAGLDLRLTAGMDYQFLDFFVGPEVSYDVDKTDDGTDADSKETSLGLLAGYRATAIEAYLGYNTSVRKTEYDNPSSNGKRDSGNVNLGVAYKF